MITLLTMLAVAKLKSRQGSASLVLILQSLTTPCRTIQKNQKQVKYLLLQQQDQGVAIACVAHLQIGRSSGAAFHSCPSKHVEALQHSSQVDREADVFPLFSSRLEIILLEDITPNALNFKNSPIASSWDLNICIKTISFEVLKFSVKEGQNMPYSGQADPPRPPQPPKNSLKPFSELPHNQFNPSS